MEGDNRQVNNVLKCFQVVINCCSCGRSQQCSSNKTVFYWWKKWNVNVPFMLLCVSCNKRREESSSSSSSSIVWSSSVSDPVCFPPSAWSLTFVFLAFIHIDWGRIIPPSHLHIWIFSFPSLPPTLFPAAFLNVCCLSSNERMPWSPGLHGNSPAKKKTGEDGGEAG